LKDKVIGCVPVVRARIIKFERNRRCLLGSTRMRTILRGAIHDSIVSRIQVVVSVIEVAK
jgi:hypothetical protein